MEGTFPKYWNICAHLNVSINSAEQTKAVSGVPDEKSTDSQALEDYSSHNKHTYSNPKDSQYSCTRSCNISEDSQVCWDSHTVESLREGGQEGGKKSPEPLCYLRNILQPPWDSNGLSIFGLARGIINAFSACSGELRGDWSRRSN